MTSAERLQGQSYFYENNIFEQVKNQVTARSAAEFYGIRVGRNGMACCPFHDDHTPSLKLDRNFICFGCQEKGDVIRFVERLFGIRPIDAARKLITDMSLSIATASARRKTRTHAPPVQRERVSTSEQFNTLETYYYMVLSKYRARLKEQKNRYAPKNPDEEWDPRFVEALTFLDHVEYLLDLLLFGDMNEKLEMMTDMKERVKQIAEETGVYSTAEGTDQQACEGIDGYFGKGKITFEPAPGMDGRRQVG